ncbi:MAG TPA: hypothetical protein VGM75_06945 [Pseudonocardiaceae bacterium]|jgi:hypothetical protein
MPDHRSHFLVEWYRSGLDAESTVLAEHTITECAAESTADGVPVDLLLIVSLPVDEVVFGLFAADSAMTLRQTLRQVSERVGLTTQRISAAVESPRMVVGGSNEAGASRRYGADNVRQCGNEGGINSLDDEPAEHQGHGGDPPGLAAGVSSPRPPG